MKKLLFFLTVLFFSQNLFSYESFRVHKTIVVDMTDEITPTKAVLEVNDALVIKVPKNPLFLKALSLEVKIPPEVAEFRDSVAYFLYTDINPKPSENIIDYRGTRAFINTFPTRLSCNLLIPLFSSVELQDSPYSIVLPPAMNDNSGYIFFRLQLVMKGTPINIWDSSFVIDVKPVLEDKGILELNVLAPELSTSSEKDENLIDFSISNDESIENSESDKLKGPNIINITGTSLYTLFIDGKIPDFTNEKIILPSGTHHLSIVSELYRSEVRTVVIEQAQTTKLDVLLKDVTPLVEISAPDGVQVFLDSEEISNWKEAFTVTEGNHLLKFILGGYEKLQSFEAFNGKTYRFSLNLDVNYVESE